MGGRIRKQKGPIALVIEGAYPYRKGGLSHWVEEYLLGMKDYDFVIVTIIDKPVTRGAFVYPLPPNVIDIQELVLEEEVLSKSSANWSLSERPDQWLKEILFLSPDQLAISQQALAGPRAFSALFTWIKVAYPQSGFLGLFHQFQQLFGSLLGLLSQLDPHPRVQLVHALSTGYAGYLAAYLSQLAQCSFLVSEHGLYMVEKEEVLSRSNQLSSGQKSGYRWFFQEMTRLSYQRAYRVTALFEGAQEQQVDLGCQKSKCQIIPNGLSWQVWANVSRSLLKNRLVLGAILRWTPLKNVLELLFIQACLRQSGLDTTLWILGGVEDEVYFKICQAAIKRWQIEGVEILGHVSVFDYLPQMTCLLLPSLSEGQPLALLEGMAAGIPCVASDVGSCAQLLTQELKGLGPAGYCVRPGDRQAFVQATKEILLNPSLAQILGLNGRQRIQAAYQQEQVLLAYQKLYEVKS